MVDAFLMAAFAVFVYMCCFFIASLYLKDNSIADVAWGGGFVLVAFTTLFSYAQIHPRQLLVLFMVTIWGVRLMFHIHARSSGQGEDSRYRQWREQWGNVFVIRSFLQVYMLQGALLLVVATPILIVNSNPGGDLGYLDYAGSIIWLIGFLFEAIGDLQLLRFIRDKSNNGKIMQTGLWKYSRHPNYFGEATLWWGVFLIALGSPNGFIAIISPVTIAFLLLKVSGIPMLEAIWEGNEEFEAYKSRTNALIPWFPKEQPGEQ